MSCRWLLFRNGISHCQTNRVHEGLIRCTFMVKSGTKELDLCFHKLTYTEIYEEIANRISVNVNVPKIAFYLSDISLSVCPQKQLKPIC